MPIKIYVDQGHNPTNPNAGAEGNGYREQDITYEVGRILSRLLRDNPEFSVRLSRPTPQTQLGTSVASSLASRVNDANSWGANYFISIHVNASNIPTANGCEGYASSLSSEGFVFGEYILSRLSLITGFANRGMFIRPSLYVLRETYMPAVLIELGFITNAYEARLMASDPYIFAKGIYDGILEYFGLS